MGDPGYVENKMSFAIDFTQLTIWGMELTSNQRTIEQERPLTSFLFK